MTGKTYAVAELEWLWGEWLDACTIEGEEHLGEFDSAAVLILGSAPGDVWAERRSDGEIVPGTALQSFPSWLKERESDRQGVTLLAEPDL